MQKFLWSTANGSTASEVFTTNTFAYIEDAWSYVVMVRKNGDTNNGCYYVNGIYQSLSSSGTILNVDNSFNLSLGIAASNYTPYCFEGKISNVQIYNRALSNSEIISNYLSFLPRFTGQDIVTNGLVLYLDAGYSGSFKISSNTWYDISGYGNNGTLTNGAAYSSLDGGSISFDGIDDHIIVSLVSAISVYCLEMVWYNNNAIPNNDTAIGGPSTYQTPIEFNGNRTGVHLGAWTGSLTNEAIHIWSGGGATSNRISAGIGYHHLVFNWNGITYDIWLDGVKTTVYYLGDYLPAKFITASSIKIGTDADNYSFNGRIPVTKIYNRTLSDNEILKNYLNYETRFGI